MKKKIMKFACWFHRWMNDKYGVLDARTDIQNGKQVQMKVDAFLEMFKDYERNENYTDEYDKLYTKEDGVTYFTLVEIGEF